MAINLVYVPGPVLPASHWRPAEPALFNKFNVELRVLQTSNFFPNFFPRRSKGPPAPSCTRHSSRFLSPLI